MKFRSRLLACFLAVFVSTAVGQPALAQTDLGSLLERTCRGIGVGDTQADRTRLLSFLLADAGVLTSDPEAALRQAFAADQPTDEQKAIMESVVQLQEALHSRRPLVAERLRLAAHPTFPGRTSFWLLNEDVVLTCTRTEAPPPADPSILSRLRLRGTSQDLTATGAARRSASSAQLSYRDNRNVAPDGTTSDTITVSLQAAVGVPLFATDARSVMIYGAYQLQEARTTPPPAMAPGVSEADKDTDTAEFGLNGHVVLWGNAPVAVLLDGRLAYIADFTADTGRLRGDVRLSPAFGSHDLGLCSVGYFREFGLGLGGRCEISARAQINHFLDRGGLAAGTETGFGLAGGEAAIDFAPMQDGRLRNSGVVAGLRYRYEAAFYGSVPDIDRFSAYLKYRLWLRNERVGFDLGFNFVDGVNPESFRDENRLEASFGIIF